MNTIHKFKCFIIKRLFSNPDTSFAAYLFTTHDELPYTTPINNDYNDRLKEVSTTKIFKGTLNGTFQLLQSNVEYDVEALLKQRRKSDKIYYDYVVQKITSCLTDVQDQMNFLMSICTNRQTEHIIKDCPDFIDRIIIGKDIPKIKFIGEKSLAKIKEKVQTNYWMNELLRWLTPFGITVNMINKLSKGGKDYKKLKQEITDNPYILTKIRGIGFSKCDDMALKINPDIIGSQYRLDAFINYHLTHIANTTGDTIITKDELVEAINKYVPETIEHFKM